MTGRNILGSSNRARSVRTLVLVLGVAFPAALAWSKYANYSQRKFEAESLVKIEALSRASRTFEAWQLGRQLDNPVDRATRARRITTPLLNEQQRDQYSRAIDIDSTPLHATIEIRRGDADATTEWIWLGRTPFKGLRAPRGVHQWRATNPDYVESVQVVDPTVSGKLVFSLLPTGPKEAAPAK